MTDKITSVAGLKKAMEKMWDDEDKQHKVSDFKAGLEECWELISEFEASVRGRIEEYEVKQLVKALKNAPPTDPAKLRTIADVLERHYLIQRELRGVLGGEGERRG